LVRSRHQRHLIGRCSAPAGCEQATQGIEQVREILLRALRDLEELDGKTAR
jgi:hypothetical protein